MNSIKYIFVATALLLSVSFSMSAEQKASAPNSASKPASSAVAGAKQVKAKIAAQPLKIRLVDINNAGRNELMTLPGVTDAVADKIIAGRPFGSKAQLTTRGLVPRDVYENLKGLVIAKQNAATTAKLLKK